MSDPVVEVAPRTKHQDPPPHVVFEALTQPHRPQGREWLILGAHEVEPTVIEVREPHRVVWSSPWPAYPSARVVFDLLRADDGGTMLTWSLTMDPQAAADAEETRSLRHRLNEIVNRDLRTILFDC